MKQEGSNGVSTNAFKTCETANIHGTHRSGQNMHPKVSRASLTQAPTSSRLQTLLNIDTDFAFTTRCGKRLQTQTQPNTNRRNNLLLPPSANSTLCLSCLDASNPALYIGTYASVPSNKKNQAELPAHSLKHSGECAPVQQFACEPLETLH